MKCCANLMIKSMTKKDREEESLRSDGSTNSLDGVMEKKGFDESCWEFECLSDMKDSGHIEKGTKPYENATRKNKSAMRSI